MATQVAPQPAETVSVVPSVAELRELDLDWSIPVLTLWDGEVVEAA